MPDGVTVKGYNMSLLPFFIKIWRDGVGPELRFWGIIDVTEDQTGKGEYTACYNSFFKK